MNRWNPIAHVINYLNLWCHLINRISPVRCSKMLLSVRAACSYIQYMCLLWSSPKNKLEDGSLPPFSLFLFLQFEFLWPREDHVSDFNIVCLFVFSLSCISEEWPKTLHDWSCPLYSVGISVYPSPVQKALLSNLPCSQNCAGNTMMNEATFHSKKTINFRFHLKILSPFLASVKTRV